MLTSLHFQLVVLFTFHSNKFEDSLVNYFFIKAANLVYSMLLNKYGMD